MKKYAFGADIGGTTVKLGLFETSGKLLETWEIPTRTQEGGKYILTDIAENIETKMQETKMSKLDVEGIGMGVPGPVGLDGTVFRCVNLGWGVFNVEKEMEHLTGLKAKAGNDANVAALGEMWQGGGQGCQNMVMITLGTGIGGGIIIGGKILPGVNGAAAEIGHIPMLENEVDSCGCGKKGCLEQYASANGIVRLTRRYLEDNPDEETILRGIPNYTSKEICDWAKKGDEVCIHMVDEVGKLIGKALAFVACVVNPEAFVIGGGMSKAGEIILEPIRTHYAEDVFHAAKDTVFKQAVLGNSAGIYGAVKLVLE